MKSSRRTYAVTHYKGVEDDLAHQHNSAGARWERRPAWRHCCFQLYSALPVSVSLGVCESTL